MARNSGWSGLGEIVTFPLAFLLHVLLTCIVVVLELFAGWWQKLWTPKER